MTHLSQLVFNDGFNDGFNNGKEAGWQDGIRAMVLACLSLKITREDVISKLQTFFEMSEEKANEYYDRFSAS